MVSLDALFVDHTRSNGFAITIFSLREERLRSLPSGDPEVFFFYS